MIITQAHEALFGEYKVLIDAECVHNVIEIDTSKQRLKIYYSEDDRTVLEERFPERCSLLHDGEIKPLWDNTRPFNENYRER